MEPTVAAWMSVKYIAGSNRKTFAGRGSDRLGRFDNPVKTSANSGTVYASEIVTFFQSEPYSLLSGIGLQVRAVLASVSHITRAGCCRIYALANAAKYRERSISPGIDRKIGAKVGTND